MTITTTLIEKLCLQEELQWPDSEWKQERLQWLQEAFEAGRYGHLEKDFAFIGVDRVPYEYRYQLALETIKFHHLRLNGCSLHEALDRMAGSAHN